jgi:hypothetical protein
MTDERRPIRQISGNLQKFQAATRELRYVTVRVAIWGNDQYRQLPLDSRFPHYAERRSPMITSTPAKVEQFVGGKKLLIAFGGSVLAAAVVGTVGYFVFHALPAARFS